MAFRCEHVTKAYQIQGGGVITALEDFTIAVKDREFVCLVGPSGCGKTTLVKLLTGLLQPTSGTVVFDTPAQAGTLRAAPIFQEQSLFPWMRVLENVAFGLEIQGISRDERHERAHAMIERMGLTGFASRYPHELSGGMQQRVAIARAFLVNTHMLLMDEPFGSLDAQTRLILQEQLLNLWKDSGKTIVYVTHDIEEAILLGERILVMTGRPGRIRTEIPVPIGWPRDLTGRAHPVIGEIKWQIWNMLEEEVRREMSLPQRAAK